MLLVHHQIVIRVNVAPDVIGVDDFGMANGGIVRGRWRLLRAQRQPGRGGTRG